MNAVLAAPDILRDLDVLILGAGPAGSTLALALKRAGVGAVLLIDNPLRRAFRMGESAAPGLGSLLRHLGLDDRLESRGHRPCHGNRSLWGGGQPAVEDDATAASVCLVCLRRREHFSAGGGRIPSGPSGSGIA